jgi:hypothetical protein
MTDDDPFDLAKLRMEPAQTWATIPKKILKRRDRFVLLPGLWQERLTNAKCIGTYRLALHILRRNFESRGEPLILSNGALALEGISREQKRRALLELEKLGLIHIERRKDKNPRIGALLVGNQ